MENFVFSSRAKTVTGGMAVFGLLLLIVSYFTEPSDEYHMRFWTNLLHNATFFTGIGLIACFAYAAFTTAYAGWFVQFKRLWESFGMFILPGIFLFGIIIASVWLHSGHLYHWNDAAEVAKDPILNHKSAFLNPLWFTGATIVILGVYYFLISSIRKISIDEDTNGTSDYSHHRRIKKWAAPMLAVIGFTSPFLIWQWIMSIDAHWYSTMFAWYASASLFVAMTALTIMLLIYLKSRGYFPGITAEHFHDLGKYLFAISIFWTYVWFSQYMLIWYGNVGEETIYFRERLDSYPVLFWGNLLLNFIMPFFILMRNDTKRKYGTLFFASAIVFFGHWFDFFNMIKPGARINLEHAMHAAHGEADHGEHATMDGAAHDDHADDHAADHSHGDEAHADEDHGAAAHDDHAAGGHGEEHGAGHDEAGHDEAGHAAKPFKAGYTIPGLLEIGIFLGFLGGFLFFVLNSLSKAPLEPKKDPYFEESLHHHT